MNNIVSFLIIWMIDIQIAAILCLIWVVQASKKESRSKPPVETFNPHLMWSPLRKIDKSIQYLIAIFAWPAGSGLVIGLIRRFTVASWTLWFGSIFALVWGAILFWMVLGPESSSS